MYFLTSMSVPSVLRLSLFIQHPRARELYTLDLTEITQQRSVKEACSIHLEFTDGNLTSLYQFCDGTMNGR